MPAGALRHTALQPAAPSWCCTSTKRRPQPPQWLEDLKKNKVVGWLTFGIKVARSVLYEFRDRVQPFLADLNKQVIQNGRSMKSTQTPRLHRWMELSSPPMRFQRHRLFTLKTVEKRLEQLDQEIAKIEAAEVAKQESPVRRGNQHRRSSRGDRGGCGSNSGKDWKQSRIDNRLRRRPLRRSPRRPTINHGRSWARRRTA